MGDGTSIEWTDMSWNPFRARNLVTGGVGHYCVKPSAGCKNCYAEGFQPRLKNPIRYAAQDRGLVDLFLDHKVLLEPLRKRDARMIFPCSMTDLFGEFYPDEWIDHVFAVAAMTPRHTFQCLTKRADRMQKYMETSGRIVRVHIAAIKLFGDRAPKAIDWPLPNWWQGVSVEDRDNLGRLDYLRRTPAAKRWVSLEPLLGDVSGDRFGDHLKGLGHLDWVVLGGESGARARPFHLDWARALIAQCHIAEVPVFLKQLGRRPETREIGGGPDSVPIRLSLKNVKGGDPAEWDVDLRVREIPPR